MSWQRWAGIMKCYPFEEKRLKSWAPPYIVQLKYDGNRCKAYSIPETRNYILLTSEENPYFSVPHIQESLGKSCLEFDLDGELYSHQVFKEGGHELIQSIVSARRKSLHPRHQEIKFYIFDIENRFMQLERLQQLVRIQEMRIPNIVIAPFWICDSLDDVKKVYDSAIKLHYEGIIIRHLHNHYQRKRSTFVMKFKPKKKDTYKIIGWKEEISKDGIPKGRIGSILLSSQTGDEFSVSAGLNDEQRNYYWMVKEKLAGCDATVHYQHLTNKKVPKGAFDIEIHYTGGK